MADPFAYMLTCFRINNMLITIGIWFRKIIARLTNTRVAIVAKIAELTVSTIT